MEDIQATNPGAEAPEQTQADPFVNLKAEMNRKLSNQESAISDLRKTNDALLSQLQNLMKPKADATSEKKLSDLWYDSPDEAARIIEERTERRIEEKLSKQQQTQAKQQQTISNLVTEFPELNQGDHELTRRAVEIYSTMGEDEKSSPVAYKAAVNSAALELGIRPKSKRSSNSDDSFSLGGSGGSNRPASKKSELDPRTEAFARAVGLDTSNKEVRERLKANHGRKSYTNWE